MTPDPITLHERCETCAFRPGTEASKSINTIMKAKFCATTGEPFLCHEHNPDIGVQHPQLVLCKGWTELFASNLEHGKVLNGWQRDLSLAMTEAINDVEADPKKYATEESIQQLIREKIDALDKVHGGGNA